MKISPLTAVKYNKPNFKAELQVEDNFIENTFCYSDVNHDNTDIKNIANIFKNITSNDNSGKLVLEEDKIVYKGNNNEDVYTCDFSYEADGNIESVFSGSDEVIAKRLAKFYNVMKETFNVKDKVSQFAKDLCGIKELSSIEIKGFDKADDEVSYLQGHFDKLWAEQDRDVDCSNVHFVHYENEAS